MTCFRVGLVLAVMVSVLSPAPSHAYLDPGTGSIILQSVIGAIAAGMVAIRIYWAKLKSFFSGRRDDGTPPLKRDDR